MQTYEMRAFVRVCASDEQEAVALASEQIDGLNEVLAASDGPMVALSLDDGVPDPVDD